MLHRTRENLWREAGETGFDVAVVGGGINGASLYHELCARGYRVLLIDKGDFASGTSQSSAMMVWGGLLYLRNLDFKAVIEFSLSRDRMIQSLNGRRSDKKKRVLMAVLEEDEFWSGSRASHEKTITRPES